MTSYKKHDFTTGGDHLPHAHQHYYEQQAWTGAYFLKQANAEWLGCTSVHGLGAKRQSL